MTTPLCHPEPCPVLRYGIDSGTKDRGGPSYVILNLIQDPGVGIRGLASSMIALANFSN
jgi:hypothetical protein